MSEPDKIQGIRPGRVVLVGGCFMDLVMRVERLPQAGEPVLGTSFGAFLGGKGFNQAVAARRAGAEVAFIGRLGRDAFGKRFFAALEREAIEHQDLRVDGRAQTGAGMILVDDQGESRVVAWTWGAAAAVTVEDIARAAKRIRDAHLLVLGLEVEPAVSVAAARLARNAGVRVLWNAAPPVAFPNELFSLADLLVVNSVEAAHLTGLPVEDRATARAAANALCRRGVAAAIVTLGAQGLVAAERTRMHELP
ncbi:MAG TPA: PfkB family carbohydrate kinase, partial [Steroidobacteraceae bacterium]|nr:PfkB family carbohydrate kinase [Steroidobacteraceae bacterium]